MDQIEVSKIMGEATNMANDNPLWNDYRLQLLASLQTQGFTSAVIEARLQIAYNRMHGIPNGLALLKQAKADCSRAGEWITGSSGKEVL